MRLLRRLPARRSAAVVGAALAATAGVAAVVPSAHAAGTRPLYRTVQNNGIPVSGAIFSTGLRHVHTCTGTVATVGGDSVVMTAAHCITGTGRGYLFVPGYHDGRAPYGVFAVQGVYVDPRWNGGRDWRYDVAALRVAKIWWKGAYRNIGAVTGTTVVAAPPPRGWIVDVTGYGMGIGDKPRSCSNYFTAKNGWGYTSCDWLPVGVSGSGVRYGKDRYGRQYLGGDIGGYQLGGCRVVDVYTPTWGPWVKTLAQRARDGRPTNVLPPWPPNDGCNGTRP